MASAQELVFPCQAPPEIRSLTIQQIRTRLDAGQDDFFLYKRLVDLTPSTPKPGVLAPYFEQRFQQHPDDARFLYLYAQSLIGKNTPEAIVDLNRAAAEAPGLPWTYTALIDVYMSRNFRDSVKAIANLNEYRKLCPANLDGFFYFDKLKNRAVTPEWTQQLRTLLENGSDPEDGRYWPILWAAEFRTTPAVQYDTLRARLAADVQRLESLSAPGNRNLRLALAEGYRLIGKMETAHKIELQLYPDRETFKAYQAWEEKNNVRARSVSEEEHRAMMEDQSRVAAEWVVEWPASPLAWESRLTTLRYAPNWTKEVMEKVGEQVLKTDAANPMGWNYTPRKLRVAQEWVRQGIRPKDCVRIGEESLDQISLGPAVPSDLTVTPDAPRIAALSRFGFDTAVWDAMTVVIEGSVQAKDMDNARRMLTRMRKWLDENQAKKDDPTSGYMRFQARYLHCAGEVAEAAGNRLDAIALYIRATAKGWGDRDALKHARALWDQQGGTRAGWELSTLPLPEPMPAKAPARSAVTTADQMGAWKVYETGQALPEMNLRDTSGKTWTLASFKDKTTFVNLWATWCAPCRDELPQLQKLYELTKDRPEIQVITLNLDENPGRLQPFLTELNYTFPVIIARQYVEDFLPSFTIPQNWLVDRTGILRQKSVGFDPKAAGWPAQMLERLTHIPR